MTDGNGIHFIIGQAIDKIKESEGAFQDWGNILNYEKTSDIRAADSQS